MEAPESLIDPGTAEEAREYRIVFWDEDFDTATSIDDVAQYTGERHEGRWHVWDEDGEKVEGEFPDSEICVLERC